MKHEAPADLHIKINEGAEQTRYEDYFEFAGEINVLGLFIYLDWNYFHPHSCRCHLANRDHCGNKIRTSFIVFIPGGKYGGSLYL